MPCGWIRCEEQRDWNILEELIDYHAKYEPPNLEDDETLYKLPPVKGVLTKLLWIDQKCVGFYFLRLQGPQEDGPPLHLNVIDGVFVKKAYRRKGWGYKMLEDVVSEHPSDHLGLSHPVSKSLKLVKFLKLNLHYRDRFWAIQNCGEEGDRLNLWFCRNK